MAVKGREERDRRMAWTLVALAAVGFVVSSVLVALVDVPATVTALAIAATAVVFIGAIVWSSLIITRYSKVGGDFVLFAGGFNVIFVWAPIVGFGMNLLAAIRLLRGMVKGGTITTTSGSGTSSNSMDDTDVGSVAKPLGACCLIAALLQPWVLGLILLGIFSSPLAKDPPPQAAPSIAERCDQGDGAACRTRASTVIDEAKSRLRGARLPLSRACTQGDELACKQGRDIDAMLEELGALGKAVARPPAEAAPGGGGESK